MSGNLYWIWVSLRLGAGRSGFGSLIEHFGSPENIYNATADELSDFFGGKRGAQYEALLDKKLDEAYSIENYCQKNRISILRYSEKGYPKLLTNLKNPPIILYARGSIPDLDSRVAISVVGTRSLSEYGRQSAYKIGYELAAAGAVVVSGLALGIDSVAACGALDAGGRTIAVLGSGLDRVYPAAHKKLAAAVAKYGMIVSEYPPLTSPTRFSFPTRNRIISGLSQGTLVVEAGEKSGALITAREAITQGRFVYAVPGNIDSENASGTNGLIKDGATAVTCASDILENFSYIYGNSLNLSVLARVGKRSDLKRGALSAYGVEEGRPSEVRKDADEPKEGKLSRMLHIAGRLDGDTVKRVSGQTEYPVYNDDKRKPQAKPDDAAIAEPLPGNKVSGVIPEDLSDSLLSVLRAMPLGTPVVADQIGERSGLAMGEVMTALTMLEVRGLVITLPGNQFIRK